MSVESGVYGADAVSMGRGGAALEGRRGDSNSVGYRARWAVRAVFVVHLDAVFGQAVALDLAGYIQGQTEVESIRPLGLHHS